VFPFAFSHWPSLLTLAQERASEGSYRNLIDTAARTPLSEVVMIVAVLSVARLALAPLLAKTPPHKRFVVYGVLRFLNEVLDAVIYAGVFVFMVIRPFVIQAFLIPSGSMWPTLYVNDFIVANKAIYRYSNPKDGDIVVFRPPIEATFQHPEQVDKDGKVTVDFIKRCQGTPGQVVELREGILYRDGKKADDPTRHYSLTSDQVNYTEVPADDVARMPMASFKFVKWMVQRGDKKVQEIIPLNYTKTSANAATSELIGDTTIYSVAPEYVIKDYKDQMKAIAEPAEPLPPGYYLMMGDNRNDSFDGRGWGMVPRASIIGRSEFIWLPISRIRITR
jgi:signal peptidase I